MKGISGCSNIQDGESSYEPAGGRAGGSNHGRIRTQSAALLSMRHHLFYAANATSMWAAYLRTYPSMKGRCPPSQWKAAERCSSGRAKGNGNGQKSRGWQRIKFQLSRAQSRLSLMRGPDRLQIPSGQVKSPAEKLTTFFNPSS